MNIKSILNDVLGPVMRGPSSSHTAGPYRIATLARFIFHQPVKRAIIRFDSAGSFAHMYRAQGSDIGFIAGILALDITDPSFTNAQFIARERGIEIDFVIEPLVKADHPNYVILDLYGKNGNSLSIAAKSIGGGTIVITQIAEWSVNITGDAYEIIAVVDYEYINDIKKTILNHISPIEIHPSQLHETITCLHWSSSVPLSDSKITELQQRKGMHHIWCVDPILFIPRGAPLFHNYSSMMQVVNVNNWTLGEMGLKYEAKLLEQPENVILNEIRKYYHIMKKAIEQGFHVQQNQMHILTPSAKQIFHADESNLLIGGGYHIRAAARALAVGHQNASSGVITASPKAGSAGVLPGVLVTLDHDKKVAEDQILYGLLAAGVIGLLIAQEATFAAEMGGCQMEIGAATAMAAAAIVTIAKGSVRLATDAAAIALQNSIGLICDPILGYAEIPCQLRTATAASTAFTFADLILGGYHNILPLDECINASYQVGQSLPIELRCTSLGGLATTPTVQKLQKI